MKMPWRTLHPTRIKAKAKNGKKILGCLGRITPVRVRKGLTRTKFLVRILSTIKYCEIAQTHTHTHIFIHSKDSERTEKRIGQNEWKSSIVRESFWCRYPFRVKEIAFNVFFYVFGLRNSKISKLFVVISLIFSWHRKKMFIIRRREEGDKRK